MSETRNGVCNDCSAEYKIPASFTHDKAKCRECGGTVEIEPLPGAVPKPAPVPAAKPPAAEPAEKPMTMKEKILARKAAEAAASAEATPPPAPKPAAKQAAKPAPKAGAGKQTAKKAGAKAPADKPAGGRKATGRKAAGAKGGRRGGRKGRTEEEPEEGGRRGRKAKPEKKPPVMGIVAIVLLAAGGGGAWWFLAGPGSETPTPPATPTEVADAELADEPAVTDEPTLKDEGPADPSPEDAPEAGASDEPEAAPEPAAPEPERVYDPMEVTYDAYQLFGPAIDTSDEQWTEIQDLVETFADMDAGAKQGRAGRALDEFGFRAIPALVNKMREFDLGSDAGYRQGYLFQTKMTELMNGINAGWESEKDEDGLSVPRAHRYNRKVVETYLKTWAQIEEDPTRWIATAKLGQEKYADQLEAYSAALASAGITEGEYIDRVVGGSSSEPAFDDEEGLDDF